MKSMHLQYVRERRNLRPRAMDWKPIVISRAGSCPADDAKDDGILRGHRSVLCGLPFGSPLSVMGSAPGSDAHSTQGPQKLTKRAAHDGGPANEHCGTIPNRARTNQHQYAATSLDTMTRTCRALLHIHWIIPKKEAPGGR